MAKVTMYRGVGFNDQTVPVHIAVCGDRAAAARCATQGGELMGKPETFGHIGRWMWIALSDTPDWFRSQLVPDNIVWEADL